MEHSISIDKKPSGRYSNQEGSLVEDIPWSDLIMETSRLRKFNSELAAKSDRDILELCAGGAGMIALHPTNAHALVFLNEKHCKDFIKRWILPTFGGKEQSYRTIADLVGIPKIA